MKDYYYFLGIDNEASENEIREVYRKLSLKYHPDKNGNDPFFVKRFQEVQEAYDTLNNPKTRQIYNINLSKDQKHKHSTLPPYIKTFSINKTFANEGDEVIIKWQTHNADFVKILPFGLEKPYGEKIFKITQFDEEGKLQFILHATNSILKKTAVQGITIQKMSECNNTSTPNNSSKKRPHLLPNIQKKGKSFLFILFIIILAILYLIYN